MEIDERDINRRTRWGRTVLNQKIIGLLGAVAAFGLSASPSSAIERFFGHTVLVTGDYPERSLQIDGRTVLKNAIIDIDHVLIVAGVGALVGTSSAGGNACEGTPFVISFPSSRPPKIDGPIDTCSYAEMIASRDSLQFKTNAVPGQNGATWRWTPTDGLVDSDPVAYQVDSVKGWSDLRSRMVGHPSELFSYGEIARQLDELLGGDRTAFQAIISGLGSGEFEGNNYFGSACTPHMCGTEEAMVFLDARSKRAYIAWKPNQKKIVVRPPVQQWPGAARSHLKSWAADF